jgi:cysteinyl-tRNA synthetase
MEKIFLYNTLTKKKEEFKPIKNGETSFYYCGPTVYWTQHIGNLRGSFCADIVRRTFEYCGYKVKMVRNYTDVGHLTSDEDEGEDKMERAAKREGVDPLAIANKYIAIYEQDTNDLNIEDPWKKPRATDHVKEMQKMVQDLLKKGFAYATPLAIYFDVSKFQNYTALSGQDLEKNLSGEGSGEVSDLAKKNPQDFALWFFRAGAHEKAIQFWHSPFKSPLVKHGDGFPGWHIECSAMSKKYLGSTLDLHMGGIEHIPTHHTNEIAQSESANGVKYVNYWLHNEHLNVDNEKMSKSKGTGFSLAEIKMKVFSPLVLRYFFLSANYRSKQNFTWEALTAAEDGLLNLYNQVNTLLNVDDEKKSDIAEYKKKFVLALSDDFNTPSALSVLFEVLADKDLPAKSKLELIRDFDKVFGLDIDKMSKIERVKVDMIIELSGKSEKKVFEETSLSEVEDSKSELLDMIEARIKAREKKEWGESDRLRTALLGKGCYVKDEKSGMKIFVLKK